MAALTDKQHAHELLDLVPPDQIIAALRFLEFLLLDPVSRALATSPAENEDISEEEDQAVARSKDWFKQNKGLPFEQVIAELGFTMEQIREHGREEDKDSAT